VRKEKSITVDSFRLDRTNECLWRGSQNIKLRPKAFAVLGLLLEHSGQLVTKEELLNAVWPGTSVGEAVLKVAVREIRESLGDDPQSPLFIETAHRRGYRFVGNKEATGQIFPKGRPTHTVAGDLGSLSTLSDSVRGVVGRDDALSQMQVWLKTMLEGKRQIVFVTGEAGIGKTALVDMFVRTIPTDSGVRLCQGQCLEQYGTSEAYLPVLEAIGRLCRDQREVIETLRTHAPMWLLQMPSLLSASDRDFLTRGILGATRERMLREMGEAIERLTAKFPMVLILEDLHWSDYSTLDLISYLAKQVQPAHLLLIGTFRTAELIFSGHPLKGVKQELLAKGQCVELPLEYLGERAVAQYLSVRFPGSTFPMELSELVHKRTEGNPLFMVNAADYLEEQQLIVKEDQAWKLTAEIRNVDLGVPDSIRQMIENQLDHLDPSQQRTLEAASVAGAEFLTAAVAFALQEEGIAVEARCDQLARDRQLIRDYGAHVLPGGETVNRYGFIHALYRNVLYDRVSASRRTQLHRRLGEWWEALYGERASEIAAELAMHFELGGKPVQAIEYIQQAVENAIRRFAYREAVALSRRGLQLVDKLPNTTERARQELQLYITLGVPLIATEGYAAPSVGEVYQKARRLCQRLGETPEISQVLWGLWTFHLLRAEMTTAREIAFEFLRLSERLPYPGLAMRGNWAMEISSMHLGEFGLSMEHFQKALSFYDPERHLDDAFHYAQNPGVAMRCFAAWSLWFLGRPDQALTEMQEALALARRLSEPHGLAHALFFAGTLHQLRREAKSAQTHAEAAIALSQEHGLVLYEAMATVTLGWALCQFEQQESGIEKMKQGLASLQSTGAEVLVPHFMALLAQALREAGEIPKASHILKQARAMSERNGEQYYLAEIYRLEGEALLLSQADDGARRNATTGERWLYHAMEVARRQNAKSLELRAAMSLTRLHRDRAEREKARSLLQEIYGGFTEAFNSADLREAKALITKKSSQAR
jgi:predicted ATPase/DNA-binding winged helix-turn-helix (wHTH) protein